MITDLEEIHHLGETNEANISDSVYTSIIRIIKINPSPAKLFRNLFK